MNSKPPYLFLLWVITLSSCASPATKSSTQAQKDHFEPVNIGLVQLINDQRNDLLQLPVVQLGSSMTLKFDLLESDFRYLSLKLIHCNADWTQSLLQDLEFLEIFNEFPIRAYDFSQTNYQDYTSYQIEIPAVKKTGNYRLAVYEEDNGQILFTRRFSVYENKVQINTQINRPNNPGLRNSHHQIDYEIDYGNLNIINPHQDVKCFVVQNHHWENVIDPFAHSAFIPGQNKLVFNSFENENSMLAWNEFRFFDIRRISNRGLRVIDQYVNEIGPQVILDVDHSSNGKAYAENFQEDLNGLFIIGNNDLLETSLNTEYVNVNFKLETSPINGAVYVTGRFNNWEKSPQNIMHYDTNAAAYTASITMKQGYYNYRYEVIDSDLKANYFEGSHFQTKNLYEIYVYFREPGTIYDQLVGYGTF